MAVPEQIGRYHVREQVGTGGFGTVWRAHDPDLDADVAIKVLAENWVSRADIRTRFTDEAKFLRRAESERIIQVHDIGTLDDGRPYFVMTYADRGTLADRLADGPLALPDARRLAVETAQGLIVLHRLGVIHRDLKPSNVLFRATGNGERLMIADLGVAKAVAEASGFTVAAGTSGYMAPEQASAGGSLDIRADVYALGAVTYEMLTGRPPVLGQLVPPSQLRQGVPPWLDAVVLQALQLDKERRQPDAAAFATALTDPQPAQPPPPPVTQTSTTPPPPQVAMPRPQAPAPTPTPTPTPPVPSGRQLPWWAVGIVAAASLVAMALPAGGYKWALAWYTEPQAVSAENGAISADVPRYWLGESEKTSGAVGLTGVNGHGKGYSLRTNGSTSPNASILAARDLPANAAPTGTWLPSACRGASTDREITGADGSKGEMRIWAGRTCPEYDSQDDYRYAEAVLHGKGYDVRATMVTTTEVTDQAFVDVAKSIEVKTSALP